MDLAQIFVHALCGGIKGLFNKESFITFKEENKSQLCTFIEGYNEEGECIFRYNPLNLKNGETISGYEYLFDAVLRVTLGKDEYNKLTNEYEDATGEDFNDLMNEISAEFNWPDDKATEILSKYLEGVYFVKTTPTNNGEHCSSGSFIVINSILATVNNFSWSYDLRDSLSVRVDGLSMDKEELNKAINKYLGGE